MTLSEFLDLNNIHCILAIFFGIINSVLLVLIARKFFHIVQLSGYKISGYSVWLKDTKAKYISRIAMLSILSLFCSLVTNFLFDVYNSQMLYSYLGLIFYLCFSIIFIINSYRTPQKTPLVQTRRMSRLFSLMFIISFIITFCLILLSTVYLKFLRISIITLTPLLVPLLVPLVHFILIPLENTIRNYYLIKAKKKIDKFPHLIKVGITGSYGKTSVKYILNKILSEKYNVCMSPHSFNTPMGLTKVIKNYLKKNDEVLIAEMGAKEQGDIKFLCRLIEPQHAILTGIGTQHYQTFGSEENIIKTKYELVESLHENSIVVFNCESENCKKLYEKCNLKQKFAITYDENSEVLVKNIKLNEFGSSFDLSYNNETVSCETSLLGKHNILNIMLSSCLALKLGITLPQIANAVKELEPVYHRLEPIKNGNVVVLDDAYSLNEVGAESALEVLSLYKNYIKVCITPGIVEMGQREFAVNEKYGKKLGETCDYVVIVNKVNEEAIKKGIFASTLKKENVFFAENLEMAKQKLKEIIKEDKKFVVLFGNDLPDNYT